MSLSRFSLLFLLTFSGYVAGFGQKAAHLPGQALASLHHDASPDVLQRRMERAFPDARITTTKVSNLLNVWLFRLENTPEEQRVLDWLRAQPETRMAQFNHYVDNRQGTSTNILPNDPLFGLQWQHLNSGASGGVGNADFDSDLAWDITTGGLTPAGDTIVLAVIDGGIDQNHSDMAANLWKNHAEIAGDGQDNDSNGYVDDFRGWNVWSHNDNIGGVSNGHGTPVSAVLGARSNNNTGVAGINWHVKIMFVAGGSSEDAILASYDYILNARKRYNESNGQSGAFVVAVNCSWGTDYGQPSDAPLWCAAFDSLGQAGILSVASTANNPVNVDVAGDLPTTCPSQYLVSVTNIDKADQKALDAGWGATHVDLAAYGEGVYTAGGNNSYGVYYGTSFAAPAVSGAAGLLYSAPCPNLIALAKSDPPAAAFWVKNLILNSSVPNAAMQGVTVTGGRLNLFSLLQEYQDQCSPCPAPFALKVENTGTQSAVLNWSEINDFQSVDLYWRQSGASIWNTISDAGKPFLLSGLVACTEYEFALSAHCPQGLTSDLSPVVAFKTDGCCEPPASIWTTASGPAEATIAWSNVTAAIGYKVRWRTPGNPWQFADVSTPQLQLSGLEPCTDYELAVQTVCENAVTGLSGIFSFQTAGCGSCLDVQYCTALSEDANEEWIALVIVGDWSHGSGDGGGGYQNFTGADETPVFYPLQAVDISLTPDFQSFPYKEFFRIYVDFNMDGDFDDDGELAFNPAWASDGPISGQINTPFFTNEGLTRMRVLMKYKAPGSAPPEACETFDFGQVEDYCALLSQGGNVPVRSVFEGGAPLRIFPQPMPESGWIELPDGAATDVAWNLKVFDARGALVSERVVNPSKRGMIRMNTENWSSGFYTIRAAHGNHLLHGKIIKP